MDTTANQEIIKSAIKLEYVTLSPDIPTRNNATQCDIQYEQLNNSSILLSRPNLFSTKSLIGENMTDLVIVREIEPTARHTQIAATKFSITIITVTTIATTAAGPLRLPLPGQLLFQIRRT